MSPQPVHAVVFDAYGTLLDVHAAMERNAHLLPPDWERLSTEWRLKQLEYSWVATLTGPGHYRDFWTITQQSLDFVCARHRIADPAVRAALLDAYRELPAYADAAPTLDALRQRGLKTAILSNGEPGMLAAAVQAARLETLLDAVISVDQLRLYKPDPRVYALAERDLGLPLDQIAFVSSNPWDAQAAAAAGFRPFWCNRAGNPVEYDLDRTATPITTLADLPAHLSG